MGTEASRVAVDSEVCTLSLDDDDEEDVGVGVGGVKEEFKRKSKLRELGVGTVACTGGEGDGWFTGVNVAW